MCLRACSVGDGDRGDGRHNAAVGVRGRGELLRDPSAAAGGEQGGLVSQPSVSAIVLVSHFTELPERHREEHCHRALLDHANGNRWECWKPGEAWARAYRGAENGDVVFFLQLFVCFLVVVVGWFKGTRRKKK